MFTNLLNKKRGVFFMGTFLIYLKAFAVGGAICAVGQAVINNTKLTNGKILVLFLLIGVFLEAIGCYQFLIDFAGAGASVPISGFGHALSKGAIEGAKKDGLMGAIVGGIKGTAAGISVAIFFSYLIALVFRPKTKSF
jgi:stage V sporulation protein AE